MSELTEEEYEQLQNQTEYQLGYPTPPSKDNLFKFFRELLKKNDSSKFGNLSAAELGLPDITVRGYQSIAINLKHGWNMNKLANYLEEKGESTLATSLSKKGFLAQLFVTQIKKDQKVKDMPQQSKGLFGFGKKQQEVEQ